MKIKLLLGVIIFGAVNSAMAAETITFQGKIDSNTCTVKIAGTASPTITLPTIGVGSLNAAGKTAGATPFKIDVTDCSTTADKIAVRFAAHNPVGDNLGLNAGSAATNVSVQLLEGDPGSTTAIVFTSGVATTKEKDTSSNGDASYNLTAQYYATGVAGPGSVTAVTDYEIIYP